MTQTEIIVQARVVLEDIISPSTHEEATALIANIEDLVAAAKTVLPTLVQIQNK